MTEEQHVNHTKYLVAIIATCVLSELLSLAYILG